MNEQERKIEICPNCGERVLEGKCSNLKCNYGRETEKENIEAEKSINTTKEANMVSDEKYIPGLNLTINQVVKGDLKTGNFEIQEDVVLKEYWSNNRVFADLFNQALFQDDTVIDYHKLSTLDTESSITVQEKAGFINLKRSRDIVKSLRGNMENSINETKKEEEISVIAKRYENVALAIIGIENQTNIDYLMPIRCMLYDAISYTKQGDALKAQYKEKRKESKDNVFPNMTKAEYTTGIYKSDRLLPIISLVMYYGREDWDAGIYVHDLLIDYIPDKIRPFIADYKMNLIQAKDLKNVSFKTEENRELFHLIGDYYDKEIGLKDIKNKYVGKKIDKMTLLAVSVILHNKNLSKVIVETEGKGDVAMDTALERWEKEIEEKGKEIGREEGKEIGRGEGREEGREETEENFVKGMLKNGIDTRLIQRCTNLSLERIEEIEKKVKQEIREE